MNANQAANPRALGFLEATYLPNIFHCCLIDVSHVDVYDAPTMSLAHVDVSTLSPRQLELAPETRCLLLWMQWGFRGSVNVSRALRIFGDSLLIRESKSHTTTKDMSGILLSLIHLLG